MAGTITVPGTNGTGAMVLSLRNTANSPITNATVLLPPVLVTAYTNDGVSRANNFQAIGDVFQVNGSPVSAANAIGPGSVASGAVGLSGATGNGGLRPGSVIPVTIIVAFQNGDSQSEILSIIVQK